MNTKRYTLLLRCLNFLAVLFSVTLHYPILSLMLIVSIRELHFVTVLFVRHGKYVLLWHNCVVLVFKVAFKES